MGRKTILLALFALMLLSFGCIGSGQQAFWKWGWDRMMGVALITVVLLLSIGYMASVFLNDEKLKAWVKKEIGQAAFSAIILVAVVLLVGSLDPMLKSASTMMTTGGWSAYVNNVVCCDPAAHGCLAQKNRACHIEIANDYLQILYETLRTSAISYLSNYWTYGFLSNMSFNASFLLDEKTAGLDFVPFAGLSMPADYFSILFELAMKLMMLVRAQQIFLDYAWYLVFPVFLSMGLVLRILYFTRKLGGLLIAIALSVYVVFPMFYVVSGGILFSFLGGDQTNWHQFGTTFDQGAAGGIAYTTGNPDWGSSRDSKTVFTDKAGNIDLCNEDQGNKDTAAALRDGLAGSWMEYEHTGWAAQANSFFLSGPSSGFGVNGPIATLATVMVFAIMMPFLALMTTLASIKVFSPLLGGDVEISVLSRII